MSEELVQVTAWLERRQRDLFREKGGNLSEVVREAVEKYIGADREAIRSELIKLAEREAVLHAELARLEDSDRALLALETRLKDPDFRGVWENRLNDRTISRTHNLAFVEGQQRKFPELASMRPSELLGKITALVTEG